MAAKKRISDDEIYQKSGAQPDDSLPYVSGWLTARLNLHPATEADFISAFLTATGGSCAPKEIGAGWERARKASEFLERAEPRARQIEVDAERVRFGLLDGGLRGIARSYAATAGLRDLTNQLLTQGEFVAWRWMIDHVVESKAEGTLEALVGVFGEGVAAVTPEETPIPQGSTNDGEEEFTTPSAPPPRKSVVLEDGVTIPEGYYDEVPNGTVEEMKTWIRTFAHKALIAEISRGAGQRKGLITWLEAKAKGFKIPDEWREDAAA